MTYCVGVLLNEGIVLASDSRTHAGVDNFATFCKMTVFERPGDRVIVLLSSGNLAGTQAVISVLKQRGESQDDGVANIWSARTMFDVAVRRLGRGARHRAARRKASGEQRQSVQRLVHHRRPDQGRAARGCSGPSPRATSSRPAPTRRSSRPVKPSTESPSSIASSRRRPA